ncbi:thioredoxin reductase (NADPH) [Desulfobotulus alkaliphilus]|uniref:Thioredoxin reductase n=1 Tax=Desulfobotulus alkaliphilus TaxID=622671 RepID=A0A562S6Q1_9BACT|nr:thioredoxin-disulfide reductase [Desulfobotulus alkaliphilus]TWI76793.1 thioredoxin reductase (NADPH) [Desulfobotulus alkaliphilus]
MDANIYDLIIIGGGPAGLTAGLYACRARMKTLLIEKMIPGGQIMITDWVENYPGFPEGIAGAELAERITAQANAFGLETAYEEVVAIRPEGDVKEVVLTDKSLYAKTLIIATGAFAKKLGIPGEDDYYGRGVSFCATCDAPFFKEKTVVAIGGGDTAVQESLYLTRFVDRVFLVHRRDQLRATRILQERALSNPKITMVWDSVPEAILGGDRGLEGVRIRNVKTGEISKLPADGCFIWIGITPHTSFVKNTLATDEYGFIIANERMETSVPGVFACGDVRNTPLRQVATAVGDAAIAAVAAEHYITA